MQTEIRSIIRNDTWVITDRPKDHKVIDSRVVFRNKYKHDDGTLDRRKARLVAKGFVQRPGINFNETFALMIRLSSIRTMAALAAENDMRLRQFDITTAYLNGKISENIFMEIPRYTASILERIASTKTTKISLGKKAKKMLEEIKKGDKVCLLRKALYGLKQTGRCWNEKIDHEISKFGGKKTRIHGCT